MVTRKARRRARLRGRQRRGRGRWWRAGRRRAGPDGVGQELRDDEAGDDEDEEAGLGRTPVSRWPIHIWNPGGKAESLTYNKLPAQRLKKRIENLRHRARADARAADFPRVAPRARRPPVAVLLELRPHVRPTTAIIPETAGTERNVGLGRLDGVVGLVVDLGAHVRDKDPGHARQAQAVERAEPELHPGGEDVGQARVRVQEGGDGLREGDGRGGRVVVGALRREVGAVLVGRLGGVGARGVVAVPVAAKRVHVVDRLGLLPLALAGAADARVAPPH